MSKKDNDRVESKRIVVTIELDIVTFPSGSQWVTDVSHVDKINQQLNDARHELLSSDPHPHLVEQEDIESTARHDLRENPLHTTNFKRIKDKDLFSALRDMLGVSCLINASMKLNPWKAGGYSCTD